MGGIRFLCILLFAVWMHSVKAQDCNPRNDSTVLVDFYGATKGINWKVKWNTNQNFKSWKGVAVNNAGCVTAIVLPNNNLKGNIPDLDLPFLEKLDISNNNILSSLPIFSKLQNLKHLNIENNRFHGELPALRNKSRMEVIKAENNQLTGPVPDYNHLTELKVLNLSNNKLSGVLPSLSALTGMRDMNLSNNLISGSIEFMSGFIHLENLNVKNNNLTGSIPVLKDMTGLKDIDLSKNNLTGGIPNIDGLKKLTKIDLSENALSGKFRWPNGVPELRFIMISHNRLSDTIHSTGPIGKLEYFYASNNLFSGPVPEMNLPELTELNLAQNNFTGSIPSFEGLPKLMQFSVRHNELHAIEFSAEFIGRLGTADVSENRLTFKDIVPFRNYRGTTITLLPQKNIPFLLDAFTVTKGNNFSINLDTDEDHPQTEFQWYKDGKRLAVPANHSLPISNAIPSDEGQYWVVMTNSRLIGFPILSDTFHLTVDCPLAIEEQKIYLCPGETFGYKGQFFERDTIFSDTVFSKNDFVCDSLYLFDIETYFPDTVHEEAIQCFGTIYYFGPDSIQLTQSGYYIDTFQNIGGCDSVVMLDLTFRSSYNEFLDYGLCPGDSLMYQDSVYFTDTDLVDTFSSVYGCDSIVTLKVRFSDPVRTTTSYNLCSGDSVMINGIYYSATTSWVDTLTARAGCDSIATVQVSVHDKYEETINVQLCSPETYSWQGRSLSHSGQYSDTLQSKFGCDSIVHLNLTISLSYFSRDTIYICSGDSVLFNNSYLTEEGIFFSEKKTAQGCDSTQVIDIRFRQYAEKSVVKDLCAGDTLILYGKSYSESGIFTDTLFSETSCDTLITLDIRINEIILADSTIKETTSGLKNGAISVDVMGGNPPYRFQWNIGDTTSMIDSLMAGDYVLTVTDSFGCTAEFSLTVPVMTFVGQKPVRIQWLRLRPNYVEQGKASSVHLDVHRPIRNGKIVLYNELGQAISEQRYENLDTGHSIRWTLKNISPGVYWFHVSEEGKSSFQVERLLVF